MIEGEPRIAYTEVALERKPCGLSLAAWRLGERQLPCRPRRLEVGFERDLR